MLQRRYSELLAVALALGPAHGWANEADSSGRDAAADVAASSARESEPAPVAGQAPPASDVPATPNAAAPSAAADAGEPLEELSFDEVEVVEPSADYYGAAYPALERALNLMTGRTLRPHTFSVVVAHRTSTPIIDDPFHNYLGFDGGGLKIGIGVRYGVMQGLDVGLYRLNGTIEAFDTYELDARYQLLEQRQHGIDLAARAGGTWFSRAARPQEGWLDAQALAYFGQLLGSTVVAERLTVGGGVLFHSDSTGPAKLRDDPRASVALQALVEARLSPAVAYDVEVSATVAGYGAKIPAFSTGPKIITNRHTFAFVISNTQYMSADGLVANTPRGPKRWILGFNITREL